MKKNKKERGFFEKWRHKYRFSILNEYTLEEAFHFHLSRIKFLIISVFSIVFLYWLFSLVAFHTPLKKFTPIYSDGSLRNELILERLRLDSLQEVFLKRTYQLDLIKNIIAGEIEIDSTIIANSQKMSDLENDFIKKSQSEKEFCANYEEQEKFNLASIEEENLGEVLVFFRPVKGVVLTPFSPENQHFACDIAVSPNEVVLSVFEGTVIFAEQTTKSEFVIAVLHENNFISFYKQNARLLKKVGEKVRTGEAVAIAGDCLADGTKPYIHFELWQNSQPVNPEKYITF